MGATDADGEGQEASGLTGESSRSEGLLAWLCFVVDGASLCSTVSEGRRGT